MSVSGKQPDQLKLGTVSILILIHHNIPEPVLIALQHIRAVLKKLYRLHDQIIKIHCIVLLQCLLVLLVQGGNLLLMIISCRTQAVFIRGDQFILCRGDR